jgi:hypothetical protein
VPEVLVGVLLERRGDLRMVQASSGDRVLMAGRLAAGRREKPTDCRSSWHTGPIRRRKIRPPDGGIWRLIKAPCRHDETQDF